ncbi:hypothetical protein D3C71_1566330 [compost metagenome]
MFYDKSGKKIEDFIEIAMLSEDNDYRTIGYDLFPDGSYVSTIWLGIDQNVGRGKPLIFETMFFSSSDLETLKTETFGRWSTEEEAVAGHRKAVLKYSNRP